MRDNETPVEAQIDGDWPAAIRARRTQPVKNRFGIPYLNLADPVEFSASQAQRSASDRFLSYDGVESAVTAVSAWMALADAQAQAELDSNDYTPAQRETLRKLSKPIVYDIALRAAQAAFRAGVEHGMEINAPLDLSPLDVSPEIPSPVKSNPKKSSQKARSKVVPTSK